MMHRRAFLRALGLFAVPRPAEAQQAAGSPRIGWLTSSVVHAPNVDAFREGMRSLGYRNINLEVRAAAGQIDRLPALAAELLALKVDVIVTDGGPAMLAAQRATTTVPIVIGASAADLVQHGLVASLARPGGNLTGFTISIGTELNGKRLELLREATPAVSRVGIVWNPGNEVARSALAAIRTAAKTLGVQLEVFEARDAHGIERAFNGMARSRAGGVLTVADALLWSQRERIVSYAARHRLPGVYPESGFAEAGGLIAYGSNVSENFRRAAGYVDKILKGAKPGDLPVEQPTKFELVINLKTAKALGLAIPPSLLQRADQVIE